MPEIYLISTLLMGALVIAVAVAIARSGQRATPSGNAGGRSGYAEWSSRTDTGSSRVLELANNPVSWTAAFIVLAVAFLGGAVLLVEDIGGLETGLLETVFLAIGGVVLVGYVFFGTYYAVRDRAGQTAAGIAIASLILGLLMMFGVVVMLLMG